MSKLRRNLSKNKLLVAGIVVLVLIGVASLLLVRHKSAPTSNLNIATHSVPADNNANNSRKQSTSPATTLNNGSTGTNTTNAAGSTSGSSSSSSSSNSNETITVTRAAIANNSLEVGTLVNGGTSGTCTLNVSQTGETTVTASNQVTLENNSYVCPTFILPLSNFPNQGIWNVSVTLSSGSFSTTSNWTNNPVDLSSTL